jgi:hypothetical protein
MEYRNHFVIGSSRSGKTTYAKALAQKYGLQHISAGRWAREQYLGGYENTQHMTDDPDVVANMTAFSLAVIKAAPNTTIDYVRANYDLARPSVIEGVRNPRDFMQLYDPVHDVVHRLVYRENPVPATRFEGGIEIIDSYMRWLQGNGLISECQYVVYEFDTFRNETCRKTSLDEVADWERWR